MSGFGKRHCKEDNETPVQGHSHFNHLNSLTDYGDISSYDSRVSTTVPDVPLFIVYAPPPALEFVLDLGSIIFWEVFSICHTRLLIPDDIFSS
jgi:hypothetical protein